MQFTVQKLMDVTQVVAAIIRENRPMPQKGKYRLARLHAKLFPEYKLAADKRDEMIKAYDCHVKGIEVSPDHPEGIEVDTADYQVPADKLEEFNAAWKTIADELVEVDVQPVPLGYLELGGNADGVITANELITLGELVTE